MNLKATIIFKQLWAGIQAKNPDGTRRYNGFALEGGSRSSKTTSIIQALLLYCLQSDNELRVSAFRQKATWVRDTVWKDFIDYLKYIEFYDENDRNLSTLKYKINNSIIEFGGLDDDQRLHGRKQNIFWINEAIESGKDSFDQLEMRTTEFFILDWNPKARDHWLFDQVVNREDVLYIHSTMLDNPFLEDKIRKKILSYEPTEENIAKGTADAYNWDVYGLGKRAKREGIIFPDWIEGEFDESLSYCYAMDFGYHPAPTTLVRVAVDEKARKIYLEEQFYLTELSTEEISKITKTRIKSPMDLIIADNAEMREINELRSKNLNVHPAEKGPGSVKAGIKSMLGYQIIICGESPNMKKEFNNYAWNDKKAGIPKKEFDHTIDPARYAFDALAMR